MIETLDMAVYAAVIESASICGAARRLGVVKSAVSRRIQNLEYRLGVTLLERLGGMLCPTEVGAAYYLRCVDILSAIRSANATVSEFNEAVTGRLRISVSPPSLCASIIAPLLAQFEIAHPALLIDLDISPPGYSLNPADFDVAIRMGKQPDSDLVMRTIFHSQLLICASPAYLAQHGIPRHPSELAHHDGLLLHTNPTGAWELTEAGLSRSFPIRKRVHSECRTHLVQAACAGLGLVLAPSFLVADAIASGDLQVVLREFSPRADDIAALYPSAHRRLHKVRALVDFLCGRIPEPCPWDARIAIDGRTAPVL